MFKEIKKKVDKELGLLSKEINKLYLLDKLSPLLSKNIKDFITRDAKRVRPILFVIAYLGFAKKKAGGLYRSALSVELLHDFMLVHDDIIDKSDTRRGHPSMHKMLGRYLEGFKNIKFSGQDLAIVVADVIYAIAIDVFLSIKERPARKEMALKKIIKAVIYTGGGEFTELLCGAKNIKKITKQDIYKIYNFKTAYYTFSCPLCVGAILAGANPEEVKILSQYGLYLGTAFQIRDDILGMFGEEKKTGKSVLVDLQEAKKTILIWYAYNHAGIRDKATIKKMLSKNKVNRADLAKMRGVLIRSGALNYAEKEISSLLNKAAATIKSSGIRPQYKNLLSCYSKEILN